MYKLVQDSVILETIEKNNPPSQYVHVLDISCKINDCKKEKRFFDLIASLKTKLIVYSFP